MSTPFVSVIIPIYNVEGYLAQCLDSCIAQDMPDAEFICVNDGSTDSSPEILAAYLEKDSRFRAVHKENGGLSSARNAGLEKACGRWIMFLDSDDVLKPKALNRLKERVDNGEASGAPWDIIIFWSDTFPDDINDDQWFKKTLQPEPKQYERFTPAVLFEERGSMPFVWRHAYSKKLLDKTQVRFDETLPYGEDVMFPMSIFPAAERFLFTDDILYDYRMKRAGSLTQNVFSDADRVVERHYEVIRHAAVYWKERGWTGLYGPDFLNWAMKFTLLKVKALPAKQRRIRAHQMMDEIIPEYGLDKYYGSLSPKGKLMWNAFKLMKI